MYNVVREYVAGKNATIKQLRGVHTKNKVILNSFQDLQRMLLRKYKGNDPHGRSQIKFGMPSLFNNGGFTLIELLVVVLIIGILAAVALPQYQKAVEKTQGTQALTLLKSLAQAQQVYYLQHCVYADTFDKLDIAMPNWTENTPWSTDRSITDTRANQVWTAQLSLQNDGQLCIIHLGRITGPYQGAGFTFNVGKPELYCEERKESSNSNIPFQKEPGDYCKKLFHGTVRQEFIGSRSYYFVGN